MHRVPVMTAPPLLRGSHQAIAPDFKFMPTVYPPYLGIYAGETTLVIDFHSLSLCFHCLSVPEMVIVLNRAHGLHARRPAGAPLRHQHLGRGDAHAAGRGRGIGRCPRLNQLLGKLGLLELGRTSGRSVQPGPSALPYPLTLVDFQ